MEALEVIIALENALLGLVSESVALVELLPEGVASAASCIPVVSSPLLESDGDSSEEREELSE